MLPEAARRRSSTPQTRKGGKAGGLAVLAGVAGLAFKNRDKLTALLGRVRSKQSDDTGAPMPEPTSAPPETGTMSAPRSTGSSDTPPDTSETP